MSQLWHLKKERSTPTHNALKHFPPRKTYATQNNCQTFSHLKSSQQEVSVPLEEEHDVYLLTFSAKCNTKMKAVSGIKTNHFN